MVRCGWAGEVCAMRRARRAGRARLWSARAAGSGAAALARPRHSAVVSRAAASASFEDAHARRRGRARACVLSPCGARPPATRQM